MLIKTLLNKVERFKSFIYGEGSFQAVKDSEALIIDIKPRRNSKPECPECGERCKTYDTQRVRLFEYVPIWAFKVFFRYAPAWALNTRMTFVLTKPDLSTSLSTFGMSFIPLY